MGEAEYIAKLPQYTPRELSLFIPVEPQAHQSVRFSGVGKFVRKYQPSKILKWKKMVGMMVMRQLPDGFKPFSKDECLLMHVDFVYKPLASFRKWQLQFIENGGRIRKNTRPDRQDNLMKALCDALSGIVWEDDSIITDGPTGTKFYGKNDGIYIRLETVPQYDTLPF